MDDFTRYWGEATSLSHEKIRSRGGISPDETDAYKTYPGARRLELPRPGSLEAGPFDLWRALHERRSVRKFSPRALPLSAFASLLWAAQGVTARMSKYHLRTAPSAGALYPYETYAFIRDVEGLEPCLGHLDVRAFGLEIVEDGDFSRHLAAAALGQKFVEKAPAVLAFTAVPDRAAWKYGDRASRYIGLDLGHAAQNACLAAVTLGLGACPVGAFLDGEANALLGLDGRAEYLFYLVPVGYPA